ncbi:MAG: isoprenylcysteine carboxylmethyltransferase family protein [Altibacter sp.]|uniref:methyltransferase family protein n=1 Tax=Altibacter sp. TaxID=2024823 RepID=UPI001E1882EE|nr:isoprenylcysteine carboxylmethyltransferase family protein [Altibacter sp.]MBZ0327324.1 isoprenylcysteine carboxylmethyltransferase family protein [Altibacter sp.]
MKKDFIYLLLQFALFTLYFVSWENDLDWVLPPWLSYVLIAGIIFGILIILFGIVNLSGLAVSNSDRNKKTGEYFGGIYKYVRHPIYIGIAIVMFSYAIYVLSLIKLAATILLVILLYFKSKQEEKDLLKHFSDYKNYKKRTGRFFPKKNHHSS